MSARPAALSAILALGGRRIRIASDREDPLWTIVIDDLARHVAPEDGAPVDAALTLLPRGWNDPSPLKLAPGARLLRHGGRKVFSVPDRDGVFQIDFHENAFFEVEGTSAVGVCYNDDRVDPMFWTELSVNHVLFLLLRRLGLFPLHAGGAIRPDGIAVLMTGESGSGKTTAALRLAAAGWPWLGDDIVLWDRNGTIHPFAKTPAATPWTVETLGLADRVRGARWTGKRLLEPWEPAPPVRDFRIHLASARAAPRAGAVNAIEPLEPSLAAHILETQTAFCATDELTGAPTPDTARFAARLQKLHAGDLATLPAFLAALP